MRRDLDRPIWLSTFLIILLGLAALYSISFQNRAVPSRIFFDQLAFAAIGFVVMFGLSRMDYRRFFDWAYIFYGAVLFCLILVLLIGREIQGAQRWLSIFGLSFQPSEPAKFAVILALARYFSVRRPTLAFQSLSPWQTVWKDLGIPFLITAVPMMLIFKQPDLGTALLFFGIFVVMLFASGLELKYFFIFLAGCLLFVPFAWQFLRPYQKDRLLVFLNPNIDPMGAGYTIIQSKIAIGSGQLFGKGWMAGTQNQLNFLPERHTDFIFSIIGEEWGLAGTLFLLVCYGVLLYSGLRIAGQVKDKFGMLVAVGIVTILALQVIINMAMVMGLCPVVGLTLPFVSYGRSSLMLFIIMLGFLLNLSKRRTIF